MGIQLFYCSDCELEFTVQFLVLCSARKTSIAEDKDVLLVYIYYFAGGSSIVMTMSVCVSLSARISPELHARSLPIFRSSPRR